MRTVHRTREGLGSSGLRHPALGPKPKPFGSEDFTAIRMDFGVKVRYCRHFIDKPPVILHSYLS